MKFIYKKNAVKKCMHRNKVQTESISIKCRRKVRMRVNIREIYGTSYKIQKRKPPYICINYNRATEAGKLVTSCVLVHYGVNAIPKYVMC